MIYESPRMSSLQNSKTENDQDHGRDSGQKGGAGRSTLATNLAGEFPKLSMTVLIDGDIPQGTSASWYAIREQAGKAGNLLADTAANHQELVAKSASTMRQPITHPGRAAATWISQGSNCRFVAANGGSIEEIP